MSLRQRKLVRAIRALSKYYGIHSIQETAELTALNNVSSGLPETVSTLGTGNENITTSSPTVEEAKLIELLIDTADGAYLTVDFVRKLNEVFSGILSADDRNTIEVNFGRLLQLHYEKGNNFAFRSEGELDVNAQFPAALGPPGGRVAFEDVGVRQMLGQGAPGSDQNFMINQNPTNPSKMYPGLSIYTSNSPRVTIEAQNTAASTIFLNGIPSVELMRAVPYVNVEFFFPRPPISAIGRQLQNLSLNKFLLGGSTPGENSVTEIMANADTTSGRDISSRAGTEDSPIPDIYSVAGMELFTSPQTLVNTEELSEATRSNPVLDKFRPLMTLQDLNINIEPSRGFLSYKRGNISFVLHDRSRLAEAAEFIRADLYGTNEITIEYGWSHPDGNLHNSNNPYGDLIDGLRIKEKYMVTNSSFTFDPSGQVNIKLNISMRGSTEFNTELMSSERGGFSQSLRDIREIQADIARLRQEAFPNSSVTTSTEIRGHQILNAAQDATGNIILTAELRTALTKFRNKYHNSHNPSAVALSNRLDDLFGTEASNTRARRTGQTTQHGSGAPTAFANIRSTIQQSIQNKITQMQDAPDPFLLNVGSLPNGGVRSINTARKGGDERTAQQAFNHHGFTSGVTNVTPTSLAKLLLLFVGQPLANTNNYDEVQMFFYPFNEYAGKASNHNIANFIVDTKYFADELARYRLEHVSRSSVMSLNQFMSFIGDILLDDPAAPSYGLWTSDNDPLFRRKMTDPEGRVPGPTVPRDDPAEFQQKMHDILHDFTPDGSFRPPQLGIHIETLPVKTGVEEGDDDLQTTNKSILRLHIYDKASTAYEPIGRMLLAAQRDQVRAIGGLSSVPAQNLGNASVTRARREIAASTISSALSNRLIERISDPDSEPGGELTQGSSAMYRIRGGPKKLKEFIMLNAPYVIFGAGGTTVKSAQMNSMQNSGLATVNLLRSFQREEGVTPSGENVGGLPMNIIPTQMNMECVGNPLLNYMQSYFLDFQTGTTADNMYAITGVGHKFTQGDFTTSVKFTPIDAWGSYRSLISTIGSSLAIVNETTANPGDEENG